MKRIYVAMLVVGLLLAGLLVVVSPQAKAQTTRMGGWVDSMVWFNQGDPSQALLQMDNNQMQLYMYYLRTVSQIQAAQADPKIGLIQAGGSTDPIFVNPSAVNTTKAPGLFNPFEVPQAREALNYLIDRAYIAREIFGGTVLTQTSLYYSATPEYGRDPVFFNSQDQKYAYNPDTARSMMFNALSNIPGVTFTNGVWYYNGNPISITIVERVEDARLQIGEYVASQLRTLGFTVVEQRLTGGAAFNIVYYGPPDTGAWQLYTEGWATTALTAYGDSDPDYYFCGGEGSNIWTISGGPYSAPPALADVCHKLLYGQYTNLTDRQSLMEKAVALGLQQSVRVWTIAGATFPYNKANMEPFPYDLAAGPWSLYTARAAQLKDASGNAMVGGQLLVGNRLQFISPWQPWKGFSWLYDQLAHYVFSDIAGVFTDPHTGEYIPLRENFTVTTAGPTGNMTVPSGVYTFSPSTNAWTTVPTTTTAVSKVSFTVQFGTWHDGSPMTMADYVYAISNAFRRLSGDIAAKDSDSTGPATKVFINSFVGLHVVDATHLDIYLNYWHVDPTFIAAQADFFPDVSWTTTELAMQTVLHNNTKISETTASTSGLTAIDLTKGPTLGFMDREFTNNNVTTSWIPPGFGTGSPFASYFPASEATTRWTDLQAFRTAHNHYYPSNGPYYIDSIDTTSAQVVMKVFANYPYPADHWASLVTPKVPVVTIGTAPTVVPGLVANFNVSAAVSGTPYDDLKMTYLVTNPATGAVINQGIPAHTGTGTFQVSLDGNVTGQFVPGAYTLETVTVGNEAAVPVFTTKSFIVIPALAYFEALLGTQLGLVNSEINNLQNSNTKLSNDLTTATNTINGLQGILYAAIAIAVVSLVIAALSVLMLMRRGARGGGKAQEPPETEGPPKGPEEL